MEAPRHDQLQLLEIAKLDSELAKLRAANEKHPLRGELVTLVNLIAAKSREIEDATQRVEIAEKELADASDRSRTIAAKLKSKQDKLASGIGMDSRELLTLQKEVETQQEFLNEATDEEFAALEESEEAATALEVTRGEANVLNEKLVSLRAELEGEIETIDGDIADVTAQRDALLEPIDSDLVREYTRARDRGGLAVIALYPDGTTSAGLSLSPIEIASVRNAAPDSVHISDDYGVIVVPVDSKA